MCGSEITCVDMNGCEHEWIWMRSIYIAKDTFQSFKAIK